MKKELPKSTKVVVIGGGVVGCSCAYHLTKFGWKDVILLERDKLTSGTTWHAAGLVSQLGPSATITKIRKYSLDLYKQLEKKVIVPPINSKLCMARVWGCGYGVQCGNAPKFGDYCLHHHKLSLLDSQTFHESWVLKLHYLC